MYEMGVWAIFLDFDTLSNSRRSIVGGCHSTLLKGSLDWGVEARSCWMKEVSPTVESLSLVFDSLALIVDTGAV